MSEDYVSGPAADLAKRMTPLRGAALLEIEATGTSWFKSPRRTRDWLRDQGLVEVAPSKGMMQALRPTPFGAMVQRALLTPTPPAKGE